MQNVSGRLAFASRVLAPIINVEATKIMMILSSGVRSNYSTFDRPKAGGGVRTIRTPNEDLMEIQRRINKLILQKQPVSEISQAYVPGSSIAFCADHHWQSRSMVGLDLKDAFGQVSFGKIYLKPRSLKCQIVEGEPTYTPWAPWYVFHQKLAVIELIQQLVDYPNGTGGYFLAQGSPTSPTIFNLACKKMDRRLLRLATNVGGVVTRYGDNIAFSWQEKRVPEKIFNALVRIVKESGFELNDEKTFSIRDGNRGGVPLRLPGVNIINGDLLIPRRSKRHARMALYLAGKEGDSNIFYGYRGYAIAVEGQMPVQMITAFHDGRKSVKY